jgi:hypothetical protein
MFAVRFNAAGVKRPHAQCFDVRRARGRGRTGAAHCTRAQCDALQRSSKPGMARRRAQRVQDASTSAPGARHLSKRRDALAAM